MLNIKSDHGSCKMQISGTTTEICSDFALVIRKIVESMNKEMAEEFMVCFTAGLLNGVVYGVTIDEMKTIVEHAKDIAEKQAREDKSLRYLQTLLKKLEKITEDDEE